MSFTKVISPWNLHFLAQSFVLFPHYSVVRGGPQIAVLYFGQNTWKLPVHECTSWLNTCYFIKYKLRKLFFFKDVEHSYRAIIGHIILQKIHSPNFLEHFSTIYSPSGSVCFGRSKNGSKNNNFNNIVHVSYVYVHFVF